MSACELAIFFFVGYFDYFVRKQLQREERNMNASHDSHSDISANEGSVSYDVPVFTVFGSFCFEINLKSDTFEL